MGLVWGIVATHGLSGQQEHVLGFHNEVEAKEWLGHQRVQSMAQNERLSRQNIGIGAHCRTIVFAFGGPKTDKAKAKVRRTGTICP